jgi:hypothetical protein
MDPQTIFLPAKRRIGRKRKAAAATSAAPVALTLVGATYDKDAPCVDLAFDRAIDIDAIDVTQVIVDDDVFTGSRLVGFETAVLVNATTVRVPLNPIDGAMHPDIHLTVSAASGIVAVDDGGTWDGADELALPFP